MRRRLAILLLLAAAALFLGVVPPARRSRDAAREEYGQAQEERQRLRVRLAEAMGRASEDHVASANGAAAVQALRRNALRATRGIEVSGLEVGATASARGAVAAHGRLVAEGRLADVLRVTRRLADPSSGVLLERVSLGAAGTGVRLEVEGFILKEAR